MDKSIEKLFTQETFIQREYTNNHHTYDEESEIYECIRQGDKTKIKPLTDLFASDRTGKLSENMLMNLRYHFVSGIAIITRVAISSGVQQSTAYTMSDLYIQEMDKCSSESEIKKLYEKAVLDFVNESAKICRNMKYSKITRRCLDYIYKNLHSRITVEELSEYSEVTPAYLSVLFKKETGYCISKYIRMKKIETAKDMLKYSSYSCADISNYLSFSSASHFISIFKQMTGMTPNEYRTKYCGEKII
jgi:YesN/AraC family two-component response regulator